MLIAIIITVILGAITGVVIRHMQPGPKPMDLFWSLTVGAVGALGVAALGAWIGLYEIQEFMTYPSAVTGAVIALIVYNIVIADE